MSRNYDVVGLGVSTIDILALVDHFPSGDDAQPALAMGVQGGGPVASALAALARLGARTAMLDALGDDWRAGQILDEFAALGVETRFIVRRPDQSSGLASILVQAGSGQRAIVYSPKNADDLLPEEVPADLVQGAHFVHLNGRHWAACLHAAALARQAGVQVSFDGGAGRYRPDLRQLLPLVDICIVARSFAAEYAACDALQPAAQALLAEGPSLVVITDGINGSWVFPKMAASFHQPAFRMPQVVDTTGCGDAYHGAFLFGLLRGLPLLQTAALASAVAALNSQALGGRAALPSLPQVEAFLRAQVG